MSAVGLATQLKHIDQASRDAGVVLVPLDRIENLPRVDELRMDKAEFQRLCASIREDGLHQPVTLRPLADNLYALVAGRHRAAAHAELGLEAVPAIIRQDLDDANAAVATAIENLARKDLSAYEEAQALRDIQDAAGLNQTQLAERIGISQPVISKRLALLQAPEPIARLAGKQLRLEDAGMFKPLQGRDDLAVRVAKEIETHDGTRGVNLRGTLKNALCAGPKAPACLPFAAYGGLVDEAIQYDWSLQQRILRDKAYRKDILALDHIVFKDDREDLVLSLDVRGAKDALERAKQRAQKAGAKKPATATRSSSPAKSPAEARRERIKNKTNKLQLQFMVDHLAKQSAFDEELVKHAYRQLLHSVGQVASRKVEQEALAAILGEYAPPEKKGSFEKPISRGRPDLVDKLWASDRLVLERYIAAVVHLHAGDYDHVVRDDQVLKFTAGKTGKQIEAAATAAVDGAAKAAAKPKAAKAPKAAARKNGAKKPAPASPRAKAAVSVPPKGSPASELIHHIHTDHAGTAESVVPSPPGCPHCHKWLKPTPPGKIPRHKDNGTHDWCIAIGQDFASAKPAAGPGKECPECKTIVKREGKGKDARLICICTPPEGVVIEVVA